MKEKCTTLLFIVTRGTDNYIIIAVHILVNTNYITAIETSALRFCFQQPYIKSVCLQ